MKKNKKGFTLIELLAVIVILAILVLIATPAITRIMTSSAKSNFKNEALSFESNLTTAFTDKMNKSVSLATGGTTVTSDTNVYNVQINSTGYTYLCMTLDDLVNEQYTKKNLNNYAGYIQMWVPSNDDEKPITYFNITNGRYFIQDYMTDVSKSDYDVSQTNEQKLDAGTKCPTNASENFSSN